MMCLYFVYHVISTPCDITAILALPQASKCCCNKEGLILIMSQLDQTAVDFPRIDEFRGSEIMAFSCLQILKLFRKGCYAIEIPLPPYDEYKRTSALSKLRQDFKEFSDGWDNSFTF
ncbi:hypothetical protein Ciccas_006129 [Cichlidogyrus casuarinus]|uniref:Uncharacterized protein n=1 Tax=Cichlidogyrus casuarinus TaxID=1844966 RepID=A0ABD2Q6P2_9PLAT